MSFLFLFIVLFTVVLNSPAVLADIRAETEMADAGDASRTGAREKRRLTGGAWAGRTTN